MMIDRRRPRLVLANRALLAVVGCSRDTPPAYGPPPPTSEPALPVPPATASGQQLTIARACAGGIERFCAGVPPRQGYIKACMRAHVTELSAGCFDTVMSAVAAAHAPCRGTDQR
jgi:hypothetical protein